MQCLPFHNISLKASFFLYISCISFFWIQAHHSQPQPGVHILYNSAMLSYFNSTFSNSCVDLMLPVSAMSVPRFLVVLIMNMSYCCLPRANFCALNHPNLPSCCNKLTFKTPSHAPSKFCKYEMSLSYHTGQSHKACSVQICISALGPWVTVNAGLTLLSRGLCCPGVIAVQRTLLSRGLCCPEEIPSLAQHTQLTACPWGPPEY